MDRWRNVRADRYRVIEKAERKALIVLIANSLKNIYALATSDAEARSNDGGYRGDAPLAFGQIFSTNGHYCCKLVEEAAALLPNEWKIASETGNANSGNTVKLYVAQL